jgi:hypothetical protein
MSMLEIPFSNARLRSDAELTGMLELAATGGTASQGRHSSDDFCLSSTIRLVSSDTRALFSRRFAIKKGSFVADAGLTNLARLDRELTPTARILELEVRSVSRLGSAGQMIPLKSDERTALVRSPEYVAIQEKIQQNKVK